MSSRTNLQNKLEEILGSENVYFQPPASVNINYPAILYFRKDIENVPANDDVYLQRHAYEVVVVDKKPDSEIVERVSLLPLCSFDRHYKSDNLNHDVFTLYY